MTNSVLSLSLLLALAVAACGSDDAADAPVDGAPGPDALAIDAAPAIDAGPSEPLIEGEPASVYYQRFVFERTGTHNDGVAAFPLTGGKNIYHLEFYLRANHEYLMFYSDGEGEVRGDGTYSIAVADADKRRLTGSWQVAGAKLLLGTLLACDGLLLDGRPGMTCRVVTPPGSAGAPQGLAPVRPYGLPTNPDDSTRWGDFH